MASTWKTVRVFISSTFRDMHAERDHLVKVVFPALRERLEKYRVYLIDIDLRWGVTREQAENDQVLDLCLQQIDECRPFFIGILGERYGWVPTSFPVDAAKRYGWIQHHTRKSLTELEIIHGVLQNPHMRGHAFFYFRDPQALKSVPEAIRREVYVEASPRRIRKLARLKEHIRYSGHPLMNPYPAKWDPEAYDRPSKSKGRLVDLKEFGDRVQQQLWDAIKAKLSLADQPPAETETNPLAEELDYHMRFMESRTRVYVGRDKVLRDLLDYAAGDATFPCLVTGPSGSGKSAALAKFLQTLDPQDSHSKIENQQSQLLVIPHFIGASPRSTNLRDVLRRFCQVFKARFGFAEDVPEETAKLSATFREFVGKVPTDTRVLLVIDALNQLDEADRAQELYWLPTELPPQVKVIVSCVSDTLAPTGRGQGEGQPVLEAFRRRKHHPVQLAALSDAEQRDIIRQVPSLSAKTLDDDQVHLLLSNPATANPLFLLVALEELRGFAPYERLNERIAAFPREGDTVTAIFTQVIERLEADFDTELVKAVLTLLACARRGLSERELQELVAGLDGADDLFPVLRQLRPYLLNRAGLIDFYHDYLRQAIRIRYLPNGQQHAAHMRLADYFRVRELSARKTDELPWQLAQATTALEHMARSEVLQCDATKALDLATRYAHLGMIERETGSLAAAREHLRIASEIQERVSQSDPTIQYISAIDYALAVVERELGNDSEAMHLLTRQAEICRRSGDKNGLCAALAEQVAVLQNRGDLTRAMELLSEVELISRELADANTLTKSLVSQSLVLAQLGEPERALVLAEQAHRLANSHGLTGLAQQIQSVIHDMATANREKGTGHKVFISSTFRDMKVERQKVIESLLPELERRAEVGDSEDPVKPPGAGPPAARGDWSDRFRFSVFHPERVGPEDTGRMIVYGHLETAAREVVRDAARRIQLTPGITIKAGSQMPALAVPKFSVIKVTLDMPGLIFDLLEATMSLWEDMQSVEFRFRPSPPAVGQVCRGWVHFWLEGVVLADIPVTIFVADADVPAVFAQALAESNARPYRTVFPSYSHDDAEIVERMESYAAAFGDEYLRDLRRLRVGQCWNPELMLFIKRADVFQLFWSRNSAISPYVEQEWRQALQERKARPDPYYVRPVYWTPEPAIPIPKELEEIHFARVPL